MDGVKPEDVIESLSLEANIDNVFQAGEGAGQSGSFFFFSNDNKLLIKTMRGDERKLFLKLLDDFILHFKKTENKSLLARIYGIFTITTDKFNKVDVLVMQNTVQLHGKRNKCMFFDLKGSMTNRKVHFENKWWTQGKYGTKKVMKDLNFLEINHHFNNQLVSFS